MCVQFINDPFGARIPGTFSDINKRLVTFFFFPCQPTGPDQNLLACFCSDAPTFL